MFIALTKKIESQNVREGKHFSKHQKERKVWEKEIWAALNGKTKINFHNNKKKKVKITSLRERLLDKGNLYGGGKALLDALVHLELIKDDAPKWCDLEMVQQKGIQGTIIEIEDL